MNKKEIWLEPVLGCHRQYFIQRCQEAILAGREASFIYLVATRPLLDSIVPRIIDGERIHGCQTLPIFLFDGLVRHILTRANEQLTVIDEGAKLFLIEQVIAQLVERNRLRHIADIAMLPGCVDSIGALIGELKRANKRPDEFLEFIDSGVRVNERDRDVARIYAAYQEVLQRRRLADPDDAYIIVQDLMADEPGRSRWLENVQILFIDGFFDFTPIQLYLLRYLIARVDEVTVNLSYDERNLGVFVPFKDTFTFFERLGLKAAERVPGVESHHPDFDVLRTSLFNTEVSPRVLPPLGNNEQSQAPPIRILSAPDVLQEVREITKEIKRLVLDEAIRPSEIGVIVRQWGGYVETIRRVFADEGIPCALDMRETITEVPAVKAALRVLKGRCGWQQIDSFIALLKNDYLESFSLVDRDAIDNAMLVVGVQLPTQKWLQRAKGLLRLKQWDLERVRERAVDPEEIELEIERLRRGIAQLSAAVEVVTEMRKNLSAIPERGTMVELVTAFKAALRGFRLQERLQEQLQTVIHEERVLQVVVRDLRSLEKMFVVLDQVAFISRDPGIEKEEIGVVAFESLLDHLFTRTVLETEQGELGGVSILAVTQARGLPFRALFIAGLIDGWFPQTAPKDWIYPTGERTLLANAGLFLEDLSADNFQKKEEHFFYQTACQATERLILTYPRVVEENEKTIRSAFIEEVRRLFVRENESALAVEFLGSSVIDVERVSSPSELARALLARLWQGPRDDEPLLLELYNLTMREGILDASLFSRLAIETQREGPFYGPFDGVLTDPAIQQQLRRRFGRERVYSASQLNTYGACPFQFFCQRILRLDPREEASLDMMAVDRGRLLHDILHQFLRRHTDESLIPERLEEYRQELRDLASSVLTQYEHLALPLNPALWEVQKRELIDRVLNFLDTEIEYQEKMAPYGVQPHWLELGFGMSDPDDDQTTSRRAYFVLRRGDDAIRVRGRIDRVDRSGNACYIAYDYKSSSGFRRSDMEEGRDLQIPLYIRALAELFLTPAEEVIGGGYCSIKDGTRTNGLYREDRQEYTGVVRGNALVESSHFEQVLQQAAQYAWQYVEGMRRGDFRIAPKEKACCPRCVYSVICRYDKNRIGRKMTVADWKER